MFCLRKQQKTNVKHSLRKKTFDLTNANIKYYHGPQI